MTITCRHHIKHVFESNPNTLLWRNVVSCCQLCMLKIHVVIVHSKCLIVHSKCLFSHVYIFEGRAAFAGKSQSQSLTSELHSMAWIENHWISTQFSFVSKGNSIEEVRDCLLLYVDINPRTHGKEETDNKCVGKWEMRNDEWQSTI